jgi:hypothetical protein
MVVRRTWVSAGVALAALLAIAPTNSLARSTKHQPSKHRIRHTPPSVIAYGLVSATCDECDVHPVDFIPLVASHSRNVELVNWGTSHGHGGVWCLRVLTKLPGRYAVTVNPVGAETRSVVPPHNTTIPTAQWIPSSADCEPGKIEIRTLRYYGSASGLVAEPTLEVSFAFQVVT